MHVRRRPSALRTSASNDATLSSRARPERRFWEDVAERMVTGERGVELVTIDGGEGGTGAAASTFTDSVAMPFRIGFARLPDVRGAGLHEASVINGTGKRGLPDKAVVAFALGVDTINARREAMLALGCNHAQKCQTGR